MKAWAQTRYGGSDVLEIMEVPKPTPQPKDLIVKVLGAALNPIDTKKRKGLFERKDLLILGWDGAGVVESIGTECSLFKPGDEVFFAGAIQRPGCFAEYVAIDERIVALKPKSLSFSNASAIPLCALTAWEGMVEGMGIPVPKDGINPNQNKVLLVVAGAGGVGSIASQIGKKILGFGTVVSTASRQESIDYCLKMGADYTINHNRDYKEELNGLGINGVDYIMDCIDLFKNFDQMMKVLNTFGKICAITGASEPLNLTGPLFPKRATIYFEMMFTRALTGIEIEKQHEILTKISTWVDDGTILCTAEKHFPWSQMRDAHDFQETGSAIGKSVFEVQF